MFWESLHLNQRSHDGCQYCGEPGLEKRGDVPVEETRGSDMVALDQIRQPLWQENKDELWLVLVDQEEALKIWSQLPDALVMA